MATQVFTTVGSTEWTWPAGVTSVFAELISGGSSGGAAQGNPATGGGGQGGSYVNGTITKGAAYIALANPDFFGSAPSTSNYNACTQPGAGANGGQSFSNLPGVLGKVSFYCQRWTPYNQSDSVYVELVSDTWTGPVVATSAAVLASTVPIDGSWAWIDFTFPTPPTLGTGKYFLRIGLTRAVQDTSYFVFSWSGNAYSGGAMVDSAGTESASGYDCNFKVWLKDTFPSVWVTVGGNNLTTSVSLLSVQWPLLRASNGAMGGAASVNSTNGAGATSAFLYNTGEVVRVGGNGGTGDFTATTGRSGAGGGAGGPTGPGGNGSVGTAGAAGTGAFANGLTYSGAGGAGVADSTAGAAGPSAGPVYGGGGSGGKANTNTDRNGGAGRQGIVVFTYFVPDQAVAGSTIASTAKLPGEQVILVGNGFIGGNYGTGNPGYNAAQSINLGNVWATVSYLYLTLAKVGAPTDNVYVEVRQGSLTGPVVAVSDQAPLSGLPVFPTWTAQLFWFTPWTMQPNTDYFFRVMLTRTSTSGSNYLQVCFSGSSTYAGGVAYDNAGAAFSSDITFNLGGYSSHAVVALDLPRAQGLAAYWPLDETGVAGQPDTFVSALDVHGTNPLTDVNSVGYSLAGKVASARLFLTASNKYFSHASNAVLTTGNISFAFSVWIYPTSLVDGRFCCVFAKDQAIANQREFALDVVNAAGDLRWYCFTGDGSTYGYCVATGVTINTWHHVACGYEQPNGRYWLQLNNGPRITHVPGGIQLATTSEFRVGHTGYTGGPYAAFDGRIDELAFWKGRSLSLNDVAWLSAGRNYTDVLGLQTVTLGPALASAVVLRVPTVAPGPVAVTGQSIAKTSVVNVPAVAPGPVAAAGATVLSSAQMSPPAVVLMLQLVSGSTRGSTVALFEPTASVQSAETATTFMWLM